MSVSVLILTLNEDINIRDCIESVSWSDDIVVLDSISTDRTADFAEESGARVIRRKFDNWSSHQNWAMENIDFKHPWVFYLDADERCPADLAREIRSITTKDNSKAAYRIRRKDFFMGKWLRRAQLYPTWIVRLFRPEKMLYERLVNPVAIVDGETGSLKCHLHHYPFSHGISHWVERHNNYSTFEALEACRGEGKLPPLTNLVALDPNTRRHILKKIFFRLPGRPIIKFFHYYLIRRGFLDGYPGFVYCVLQSFYEFLIDIKQNENKRKELDLTM